MLHYCHKLKVGLVDLFISLGYSQLISIMIFEVINSYREDNPYTDKHAIMFHLLGDAVHVIVPST